MDFKCSAIFKNVAHSLELCETPTPHQVPNYVQRSLISQNTVKKAEKKSIYCKSIGTAQKPEKRKYNHVQYCKISLLS